MSHRALCLAVFGLLLAMAMPAGAKYKALVVDFSGQAEQVYLTAATDETIRMLLNTNRFGMVDKSSLNKALSDRRLMPAALQDEKTALAVAAQVGADMVFLGYMEYLASRYDQTTQTYTAEAHLVVKALDGKTAQTLQFFSASGRGMDKDDKKALLQAVETCFDQAFANRILASFSLQSTVVQIQKGRIQFPLGSDHGVKRGSRLRIMHGSAGGAGLAVSDVFMDEVGLAEVVVVHKNVSEAVIVWSGENIQAGDLLMEVTIPDSHQIALDMSIVPYTRKTRTGNTDQGTTAALAFGFGSELPMRSHISISGNVLSIEEVTSTGLELAAEREWRVIGGLLYLTVGVRGGVGLGRQEYSGYDGGGAPAAGQASAVGLYGGGTLGFKCYLGHQKGLRFAGGLGVQSGPAYTKWTALGADKDKKDVGGYVSSPELNLRGIRYYAGLSFSF